MAFAELAIAGFVRTDAQGTRRGIRLTWTDTPGAVASVRWQLDGGPWYELPDTTERRAELLPASPGRYVFSFQTHAPGRSAIDQGFYPFRFYPERAPSELALPKVSGVELVGPSGELLGQPLAVTLRDLKVRWTPLRADALEGEGLGEVPPDELLEFVELRLIDPARGTLRVESIPIGRSEYAYTYADSTEDYPLTDPDSATVTVRLELRHKDVSGRLSRPAVVETAWTRRLSATPDLQLDAVNEFALLSDETSVALTATVNGDPQVLETLAILGPPEGSALIVRASDFNLYNFDFGGDEGIALYYTLRVYANASPSLELGYGLQYVAGFQDTGDQIFTFQAQELVLEIIVEDLVPGELYTVELAWGHISGPSGTGGFDAAHASPGTSSEARRIIAQAVKR